MDKVEAGLQVDLMKIETNGEGGRRKRAFSQESCASQVRANSNSTQQVNTSDGIAPLPSDSHRNASKLAHFKHTRRVEISPGNGRSRLGKKASGLVIIYVRYSSDLQRPTSCEDQERMVRRQLDALDIDHTNALVIKDEGESALSDERLGLLKILQLAEQGKVSVVAADEQSRLSRTLNAASMIQDLDYRGVRVITKNEGLDTHQPNWQVIAQISGLRHNMASRDTADRVRRGQEGRVRDGNGSAGDVRFGFKTRFEDLAAAAAYDGRGPKPKKVIEVDPAQKNWVVQIFIWFADNLWSISKIARELTNQKVAKSRKGNPDKWRAEEIRRILSCAKYVGVWTWGKTKTVRDSSGNKKQIALNPEEWTVKDRASLRIVQQELWDRAQARLHALHSIYGQKGNQAKRGPRVHHTAVYPGSLLSGLLLCGECRARLTVQCSSGIKYFGCPQHRLGGCKMIYRVPLAKAEEVLIRFLSEVFLAWPAWMKMAEAALFQEVKELTKKVPLQVDEKKRRLTEVEKAISNFLGAVERGGPESDAVMARIKELENKKNVLCEEVREAEITMKAEVSLPSQDHVKAQMARLPEILRGEVGPAALLLRQILAEVTVKSIVPSGKVKGYGQLTFNIDGWKVLTHAINDQMPYGILSSIQAGSEMKSPTFVLDVGGPSRRDEWAPKISDMRSKGIPWNEIGRITGLGAGNAWIANDRWVKRQPPSPGV